MAEKRTVFLTTRAARQRAHALIDAAPEGYVMRLAEPTRSDAQNRLMWPAIQDLQNQIPECATFSAEDMKLRLMNALGVEMRFLPVLEGAGMFPVGYRSSQLTVSQFSLLIDLIHKFGAERGVVFRDQNSGANICATPPMCYENRAGRNAASTAPGPDQQRSEVRHGS